MENAALKRKVSELTAALAAREVELGEAEWRASRADERQRLAQASLEQKNLKAGWLKTNSLGDSDFQRKLREYSRKPQRERDNGWG
jgi:hypothetical protein